jgi:thiamine biosynthesis lipoprotein
LTPETHRGRLAIVAVILAVSLAVALIIRGTNSRAARRFEKTFMAMGTFVVLSVYAEDQAVADRATNAGERTTKRLEALLSHFDPDSDVSRINRASAGTAVAVSPETISCLTHALALSRLTDGAFDVTVGPLVKLWKDAGKAAKLPADDEINAARARVSWQAVSIDENARTVVLEKDGMYLDISAVAKGFIMDQTAAAMREAGARAGFANGGGDIAFFGANEDGGPWSVGVADPRDPGKVAYALSLGECGVLTSGNYEQFSQIAGKSYSHIIDPRTGWALSGGVPPASVTVVAPTAAMAAGWSTGLCVLGRAGTETARSAGVEFLMCFVEGDDLVSFESPGMSVYKKETPR